MFCPKCGAKGSEDARFCQSCGAEMPAESVAQAPAAPAQPPAEPVAQPPAAPAQPQMCAQCGTTIGPGRRYCTNCGSPVPGAAPARPRSPVRPGEPTPVPWVKGRSRSQLMVGGGYVLAAIATFLAWFSADTLGISVSVSGWGDGVRFRVADWLGVTAPIDALLVIALAALGMIAFFAPRYLETARYLDFVRRLPYPGAVPAGLIVVLALLQIQFLTGEGGELGNVGVGIWAMLVGGAVALVGSVAAGDAANRTAAPLG